MANQALVQAGSLVLDPFVGTGSLLVAAAKCGGMFIDSIILRLISNERKSAKKLKSLVFLPFSIQSLIYNWI